MTIRHHPSDETLARHAAGALGAGQSVVIATHLAGCAACRAVVAKFESVGGLLLEQLPPTRMAPEALARTLAMIDGREPVGAPRARPSAPFSLGGIELPATLRGYEIGRWRWLAPGIRLSRVNVPLDPKAKVMLFRIGPNKKLPEHGHTGTELTQIISGSFSDGRGRYFPGDIMEADAEVDHQPVVDADGECICLAAAEGRMRLHGIIGRMLQPFIGL